jgi:hypothetical protein
MRHANRMLGITFSLALAGLLFASGCADKLTYDNFKLIRPQRTVKMEVENYIGEPDDEQVNPWTYSRYDKGITVIVSFDENDVVARKRWIDGQRWVDSEESGGLEPGTKKVDTLQTRESD